MKKALTYRLYLLAKPGDERFFVFTRLPNAAWLKTQRENGFEFLETIVYMPKRYNIDVDDVVANTIPETVKEEPVHAEYDGYDLFRIRKSGKYYVYQNNEIADEWKRVFFECDPQTEDSFSDDVFPLTLWKHSGDCYWVAVTGSPNGFLVRPVAEPVENEYDWPHDDSEEGVRAKEELQGWLQETNKQAGVVTEISDDGSTVTVRLDSDPTHVQVGGDHYAKMAIQPEEYIDENNIGFHEGCVIKYVSRWKDKGGLEDLRKARHFLDLKIARAEKKT